MGKTIDSNKKTCRGPCDFVLKIISLVSEITIEPSYFALICTSLINNILGQNLILDTVCRVNLNFTSDVCDSIVHQNGNFSASAEVEIQKIVASIQVYRSIIDNLIPIIVVLLMGPWSDRHGRKIPMLMGIGGYILQSVVYMVFSTSTTVEGYTVGLTTSAMHGIGGGVALFDMSAYSYLVDKSTDQQRTVRMGILNACKYIGLPVGLSVGGALASSSFGNFNSFAVATGLSSLAFLNILITVKNTRKPEKQLESSQSSCVNPLTNVVAVVRVPFQKRENGARFKILILLVAFIGTSAILHGEFNLMYLFLRKRLSWNVGNYAFFQTYNSVLTISGNLFAMGILSHTLKIRDALLGSIAGLTQISASLINAFAYTSLMIYLAPTVNMMNGTMQVVTKSMVSKLVHGDDSGKLFSLISILDQLTGLVMNPLYSTVYKYTVDVFEGSFFFLSAAIVILAEIIVLSFLRPQKAKIGEDENMNTETASLLPSKEKDTIKYT